MHSMLIINNRRPIVERLDADGGEIAGREHKGVAIASVALLLGPANFVFAHAAENQFRLHVRQRVKVRPDRFTGDAVAGFTLNRARGRRIPGGGRLAERDLPSEIGRDVGQISCGACRGGLPCGFSTGLPCAGSSACENRGDDPCSHGSRSPRRRAVLRNLGAQKQTAANMLDVECGKNKEC